MIQKNLGLKQMQNHLGLKQILNWSRFKIDTK